MPVNIYSDVGIGVFLFGYTCGSDCLLYLEIPDGGGEVGFSADSLSPGRYSLVIDGSEPSDQNTFSLETFQYFFEICIPNFDTNTHQIDFPIFDASLVSASDELFFDHVKKDTFDYKAIFVPREEWSLGSTILADFPFIDNNLKCGYTDGDLIVLKVRRPDRSVLRLRGLYEPLDPLFNITAQGVFTPNARSVVRYFFADTLMRGPFLRVPTPERMAAAEGDTLTVPLQTNASWFVDIPPELDWLEVDPTQKGASTRDVQVYVSRNVSQQMRSGIFRFIGPEGLTGEVTIKQLGYGCFQNPLSVRLDGVGPATEEQGGFINVTVEGGIADYELAWTGDNNFTGSTEDLSGLAAGMYSLTVTDQIGCQAFLPTVEVEMSVAVRNLVDDRQLRIYPNPTNGSLTVAPLWKDQGVMDVKVFNPIGQVVLRDRSRIGGLQFDLSHLDNGAYLIEVQTRHYLRVGKVILARKE